MFNKYSFTISQKSVKDEESNTGGVTSVEMRIVGLSSMLTCTRVRNLSFAHYLAVRFRTLVRLNMMMEESPKRVISTLSYRPVSHTCSLEYDEESATSRSKLLPSSKIPSTKTSLSV